MKARESDMKKFLTCLCLMCCLIMMSTTTVPPSFGFGLTEVKAAAKPVLSRNNATMIKGNSLTLKVKNNKKKVSWSSSNKKVVTVSSKGVVKAIGKGNANVTAKISGKKYVCKIKVETPSISAKSLSLYRNKTAKLTVKGNSQKVKWSSSNTKIAKVSKNGVVTGVKAGKAVITASVSNKKYKSTITVKNPNLQLNVTSVSIIKGKTYKVTGTATPKATITWKTSNASVATVNSSGVMTGKKVGTATISAKANGITKTVKVTVKNPPVKYYGEGMYKVGKDIPAGEYVLYASDGLGYFSVNKNASGSFDAIITNEIFQTNSIITVTNGQYLEMSGCKAAKASAVKVNTSGEGMLRVGVDIAPGTYQLIATRSPYGYVEVSSNSLHKMDSIVMNDNFPKNKYIEVKKGQYLTLSGCKIKK